MFSLNSMKKLERLNKEKTIHNGRSYGPVLEILGIFILIQQWLLEENNHNNNSVFLQKHEFNDNGTFDVDEMRSFR